MRRPNLSGGEALFGPASESDAPDVRPANTGRHIIVFRKGALDEGIQLLKAAGLKVVTSDGSPDGVLTEDQAGDADVLVFPRLGTALLAAEPEKVVRLSNTVSDSSSPILNIKPEKVRHILQEGGYGLAGRDAFGSNSKSSPPVGYGPLAVGTALLSRAATPDAAPDLASTPDESQVTYGLQITRVVESPYSGRGVRVAVLDTGIDFSVVNNPGGGERVVYHPDFEGRTITTQSFVDGVATAKDDHGHGTHCVGTACGPRAPSKPPRYGIAYEAEIYIGKVMNQDGRGADAWIHAGLDWAIKNGCQVASMSLGSKVEQGESFSADYEQIAQRALEAGTLIVAAAGNDSERPDLVAPVSGPANCPSVMAVAAVDFHPELADFSNGGVNPNGGEVDIAAPGVSVYSSYPLPTGHTRKSGTSMATPHVAGIAALYAEANPGVTGKQLWDALTRNALRLPLLARDVGDGLVQAPLSPEPKSDGSVTIETHDPIIIDGGSATINFDHETFANDPAHPERFSSGDHFISGLTFRNNETGGLTILTTPQNGQCTITVHCDYQGDDRPIVISGRLIQIFFDPAEYPPDSLAPREHRSARRRITGIDVRDDNPGGTTTPFRDVPPSGLCRIRIDVGHP